MSAENTLKLIGAAMLTALLLTPIGYFAYRSQRSVPGTSVWMRAREAAWRHMSGWSGKPRELALVMIERYGPPDRMPPQGMVWLGPPPWTRISVRADRPEAPLEQTVVYDLDPARAQRVRNLDRGVDVDVMRGELSARADSDRLVILALNLADDIAAGRRAPSEAREFYDRTAVFEAAGKSSPYLDGLLFKPRRAPLRAWDAVGLQY